MLLRGTDILSFKVLKSIEFMLEKRFPTSGATNIKKLEKTKIIAERVIKAAKLFGIDHRLTLIEVSLFINGFPIRDSTADIRMYIRILLKYQAIKPIISAAAIPIIYLAS